MGGRQHFFVLSWDINLLRYECSSRLQHPRGKVIPISFIGIVPFIKYNPLGGSEFMVTQILAKKFGFMPNFLPERAFDVTRANGTTHGMVHRVILIQGLKKPKIFLIMLVS